MQSERADTWEDQGSWPRGELNRDLLFGLVALQNGFIDQSALVAAFHSWVRDKSQSLAAYLDRLAVISTRNRRSRSMGSSHCMSKTTVGVWSAECLQR